MILAALHHPMKGKKKLWKKIWFSKEIPSMKSTRSAWGWKHSRSKDRLREGEEWRKWKQRGTGGQTVDVGTFHAAAIFRAGVPIDAAAEALVLFSGHWYWRAVRRSAGDERLFAADNGTYLQQMMDCVCNRWWFCWQSVLIFSYRNYDRTAVFRDGGVVFWKCKKMDKIEK